MKTNLLLLGQTNKTENKQKNKYSTVSWVRKVNKY